MGKSNFQKLIIVINIITIIIFLIFRFQYGMNRYFDIDEFAHLHWGYSLYAGEKPYTDFFYLFPPFFLYPVAFLFTVFGRTITSLIQARVLMFLVFVATTGVLFSIAKKLRGVSFALLTAVFFVFLPLPSDKMLEVRPDLMATGLALLGLYLFIKGDDGDKPFDFAQGKGDKGKQRKYFFFSGLSYAASLGFVPKTVFFLVPIAAVFLISNLSHRGHLGEAKKKGLLFFLGFVPILLLFLSLLILYGNPSNSFYSMTKIASQVTATLGSKFYMRPDIFFYPNQTYYGLSGYSLPYLANLVIYISASLWAIHRFLTFNLRGNKPFDFAQGKGDKGKRGVGEFLIGATFFANLYAFVYLYPLKHAQYLIMVAPFIAFYFADLLIGLIGLIRLIWVRKVVLMIVLATITFAGWQMYREKLRWTNKATLERITKILATVATDDSVFDLTGETIFFKNGYYFCCLPYGQYEGAIPFSLPNLEREMEKKKVEYIFVSTEERLAVIPPLQAKYIREKFISTTIDSGLWRRR